MESKQHKMKELSIPRELMNLVMKKSVSAPSHITVNYLHFTLVSMDNNEKFRSFKSKENIHKKEVGPYRGFGY